VLFFCFDHKCASFWENKGNRAATSLQQAKKLTKALTAPFEPWQKYDCDHTHDLYGADRFRDPRRAISVVVVLIWCGVGAPLSPPQSDVLITGFSDWPEQSGATVRDLAIPIKSLP
jgi:hypothetical protein